MTIFSKIIAGDIPSYKIAENDRYYAFLDINPVRPGHTLVVPKREEYYFFDLTDDELAGMMSFSKQVAKGIKAATGCIKVGVAVMGLEVNHAHIHLIPISHEGDMNFADKVGPLTPEVMLEWAERIRKEM